MLRSLGGVLLVAVAGCGGATIDAGSNGSDGGADDEGDGGVMTVASEIQEPPWQMVSDGTTLFWLTDNASTLSSMPVGGGAIKTVLPANVGGGLLAVDDVNVYIVQHSAVYRVPKDGSTPSLVSESGVEIGSATTLGTRAYWFEVPTFGHFVVKSAPLKGGPASMVAEFETQPMSGGFAVTTSTIFFGATDGLADVPIGSDSDTPKAVAGFMGVQCQSLVSDTDAVYCDPFDGSVTRIATNGSTTALGMAVNETGTGLGGPLAIDDTYVYWVDYATVGTIMKAPKTGGTATIIARDTSPIAIAVDATSVYWSDMAGQIKRLAK
jgi:hypothetical protein